MLSICGTHRSNQRASPLWYTVFDDGPSFIYGVDHVVNVVMGKEKSSLIHYMAVVMEVLLLGYESLVETALKLMNCVSIGSGKWLFIDVNVPCMQRWQYLLLAYIAIFLIPFIIVLYYGSYQLQRSSTT